MKYEYNPSIEAFERKVDGVVRGRKIWANIDEARRIVTMYDLGNNVSQIYSKINFNNPKAKRNTVKTIIDLYVEDDIELNGDFPAPSCVFDDVSNEAKLNSLEERIKNLEDIVYRESVDIPVMNNRVVEWLKGVF